MKVPAVRRAVHDRYLSHPRRLASQAAVAVYHDPIADADSLRTILPGLGEYRLAADERTAVPVTVNTIGGATATEGGL